MFIDCNFTHRTLCFAKRKTSGTYFHYEMFSRMSKDDKKSHPHSSINYIIIIIGKATATDFHFGLFSILHDGVNINIC